ncbi:WD repeat-containing protein 27 [Trichoplax sp. H2]|nr:WD repeat-containing protein 27 [Trichoplax sp. H2]|eukprot:RDD46485.1 WD repeat-containing protein 27 [Trichoplax sp. H2]
MAFHSYTTSLVAASQLGRHVPLACSQRFIALPWTRKTIGIWKLDNVDSQDLSNTVPQELTGHSSSILLLAFNPDPVEVLLCSACSRYIILWDMNQVIADADVESTSQGTIIYSDFNEPSCLCISSKNDIVAVGISNDIILINLKEDHAIDVLVGHTGRITATDFSYCSEFLLVSSSEDRTFKVWDIYERTLLYDSGVLSTCPLLSLALNPLKDQIIIGDADGKIRAYDVASTYRSCRCLQVLDLEQRLRKRKELTDVENLENADTSPEYGDPGVGVIALAVINSQNMVTPLRERHDNAAKSVISYTSVIEHVIRDSEVIYAATTGAIVVIDGCTLCIRNVFDLADPQVEESREKIPPDLRLIGSCTFSAIPNDNQIRCLLCGLLQNVVHVIQLERSESPDSDGTVSIISNSPLDKNSPLKAELTLKPKPPNKKKSNPTPSRNTRKGLVDKPLTFKAKIKSSGYATSSVNKMFQPRTDMHKKTIVARNKVEANGPIVREDYPIDCPATTSLKHKLYLSQPGTGINSLKFSGDGSQLACVSADKSIQLLKSNHPDKSNITFTGHDRPIASVNWNRTGQFLLSTSMDKTARIWYNELKEPVLIISKDSHNFKAEASNHENKPFTKDIAHAAFYYMDKFFMLASGNSLYLYKYHLDIDKLDDVKRYQNNNRYKLVTKLQIDSSQSITTFDCANEFYSYIVVCGSSSKGLEIFDMNVSKCIQVIPEAHARSMHTISINKGSTYVAHPSRAYNLVLTSAVTDGIKLWDLRTSKCVRRYDGHVNRSHPVGVCMSPCMRYIATGSEDKTAYLYDVRSNTYSDRLTGHRDVVFDVAFNPRQPQLVTASLDGQLRFYIP